MTSPQVDLTGAQIFFLHVVRYKLVFALWGSLSFAADCGGKEVLFPDNLMAQRGSCDFLFLCVEILIFGVVISVA